MGDTGSGSRDVKATEGVTVRTCDCSEESDPPDWRGPG